MVWDTVLLVVTIAAPIVMVIIEKAKTLYSPSKKPTKAGWLFLTVAIIGAIAGLCVGIRNNSSQTKLENNIDSLKLSGAKDTDKLNNLEKQLHEIGYQSSEVTGKLVRIDSQSRLNKDNVFIISQRRDENLTNPQIQLNEGAKMYSRSSDSIVIAFSIKNFGKRLAKNISATIIGIDQINGALVNNGKATRYPSETQVIAGTGVYSYFINYGINRLVPPEKEFVYVRISYSDEKGNNMPPFRYVFVVSQARTQDIFFDPTPEEEKRIRKAMQLQNHW